MNVLARDDAASRALTPERGQPWLAATGLGKRFGALAALDDVSLQVSAGEIVCLLGENGAGKSTLCNLVFGVHQPDTGSMSLGGVDYRPSGPAQALAHGVAMVHQHFSLVHDCTVVDNLLLGQQRGVLRRKECADRVIALGEQYGLRVEPFARIDALSVGERQRVEIIKCLMREPKLLVLDEPTAVLLPDEIAALLQVCQRVAQRGCAIVLVTHKLAEIRRIAQKVVVLRGGRRVAESSDPANEMDRLVRAMVQREGTVTAGAIDLADRLGSDNASNETDQTVAHDVLVVDGLSVRDAQGVHRLEAVTLIVRRSEIVGVAGVEGNGQSELAAVLAGMQAASSGRFHVDNIELTGATPQAVTAAGVGIIPEDRHATGVVAGMSVAENLFLNKLPQFTRFGLVDHGALARQAQVLMKRFDVRAASATISLASLSGGNQQKVVLARELTLEPLKLLVAAQPTRGLDVGAVEAVYRHIRAAAALGAAVLLISSELDELLQIADRIVVMYRGRLVGECVADASQRERIGAMMAGQGIG